MPNQYWRSPVTVRRLNGLGRPGFAAEFLRRNAAWLCRRRNRRRPARRFVLPAVCCCSIVSECSPSLRNGPGEPFGRRRALLLAAAATWAACGALGTAGAAPLSAAEFEALAARCVPSVPTATLEAVAKTESALDPLVLHDNTTNRTAVPASLPAALARAERWINRGDSVDLGLMQINDANLARLGLSVANAFDSCRSIQAGAQILEEDYRVAVRDTLSRYNTGNPVRGIINGYVARVEAHVPDIAASRLRPSTEPPPSTASGRGWNIFASTNGEQFVSANPDSGGH